MFHFEPISTSDMIGFIQCALIWYGLNAMRIASKNRSRELDELIERTSVNTLALDELVRRTGANTE